MFDEVEALILLPDLQLKYPPDDFSCFSTERLLVDIGLI